MSVDPVQTLILLRYAPLRTHKVSYFYLILKKIVGHGFNMAGIRLRMAGYSYIKYFA